MTRAIDNIVPDLEGNLQRDFNNLIRAVLVDLSQENPSPVDTGFFASSWTASTQRPRPDQPREDHAPWSNIKPNRKGGKAVGSTIQPRFINELSYSFKPFSKVFIGNRSQYAARALASRNSHIPRYVQSELASVIKNIFTNKPKLGVATFGGGVNLNQKYVTKNTKNYSGGIGLFGKDGNTFVDYTNL
jgi:hypothetical protein|tara:strand:+ start:73 stop:636 length:564 start_codon:yes stop_codon:yes gene_type:complete